MSTLPDAALLAWWGSAWLRGDAVTDLVLDALAADGDVHTIASAEEPAAGMLDLLAALRRTGATSLGLALPEHGDPLGLGGPGAFNSEALEQGEAVVAFPAGIGAVPHRTGRGVQWSVQEAGRRSIPDLGEADRSLRSELLQAGHDLAALDVARWRPEVADALMNLRHLPVLDPPPGTPPRCVDLAARALQARAVVELALNEPGRDEPGTDVPGPDEPALGRPTQHHGWALTAAEVDARTRALVGLDRAARRALVAACSPEVWPE